MPSSKVEQSTPTQTKSEAPMIFKRLSVLIKYLSEDALGGPRWLKLSWVVNLQKGGTLLYILVLIWWFDMGGVSELGSGSGSGSGSELGLGSETRIEAESRSAAVWVYLGLHGSYGLCWLLKELTFPDLGWQRRVTWAGGLNALLFVLGPYWIAPTLLVSGALGADLVARPAWWIGVCIIIHTVGLALMIGADAQKFFTLRLERGLITSGFFRYIRHPNYTGEMMIYGAYALLVWHWLPVCILAYVWGALFATNIALKEESMSRYTEWAEYRARTGLLLPRLW